MHPIIHSGPFVMSDEKYRKKAERIKAIYDSFHVKMAELRKRQRDAIEGLVRKAEEKKIEQIKRSLGE